MNTLKILFSSALTLIVVLMLSLFTACSEVALEANVVKENPVLVQEEEEILKNDGIDSFTVALEAVEAESLVQATTKKVSSNGVSVLRSQMCTGIDGHEPVGAASSFGLDVGRIYLFTRLELPVGTSATVQHVWKLDERLMSVVDLEVRGPGFRTWSYKAITDQAAGKWTVDVVAGNGDIVETVDFWVE